MSSPIHIDNLSTTSSINHHDIDLALSANLNNVLNHMSVDVLDSTTAATPYMFNPPHFSRQSLSTTVTTTTSTPTTASNSDHLLPYSTTDFTASATASAPKQTLFSFSSSSTPASTTATSSSSGHFTQNHTQSHSNGVSLLTTGGEAQVPKTVVVDNLLEKVMRTTQDARDAFAQSRSQDGKQRLAELKAVVDLLISFVSSPVSSKPSPPGLKPLTSFTTDSHSNSYQSHPLPSHSHSHTHSTHHHHPYHFQPPSQRVSPTGVKKSSSSNSRKSSLSGTVPQLIPSLPSTTTGGSTSAVPTALEDGPRKRCASPQNDRAVVKSLKLEPKEEPLLVSLLTATAVPTATASVATAAAASFASGAPSSSSSGSVAAPAPVPPSAPPLLPLQPAIPPQFVHSNSYPSASGFHPHSHVHAHQHPRTHGLAPLPRIASHPNLESLSSNLNLCLSSSSNSGNGSNTPISNAALAHQLNLMQQQQQQQQQQHQIPLLLGHTHSLSTSHIPTVHSSFLSTTATMNDEPAEAGADSSLQSPIPVASTTATTTSNTAITTTTTTTNTNPANHHPRFHLRHPNPSLSTLPLSHSAPPLTRPTRSASHSGALSFSSFDLLSSTGSSDTATSTNTSATSTSTPAATTSVAEADLTGVDVGVGSVLAGSGSISSSIEVPPPPSSSTKSSSPDSEREDSPGRLHGVSVPGAGAGTESSTVGGRATDSFASTAHQNNDLSPELKAEVDRIFFEFMNMVCSDLDAKDNKGEPIHQPLMAKKMQRLDESRDFRPFKFRIQAFTNGFLEELAKQGLTDEFIPMKKVRHYLWTNPYISRFNEDGKKAKSKGNHIWNIDARKCTPADGAGAATITTTTASGGEVGATAGGQWIFRPFKRKIAGTFPNIAYIGMQWQFRPRVWDPQASRSNLHHNTSHHGHHQQTLCFTSPSLPSWLSWNENGDTLSGTPGPDAQSVEFIIEAKEGKETILSQTYFLSVAPLTREGSGSFHSSSGMPPSAQGPRRPSIANEMRVSDTSTSLRSTRPVAAPTSAPAALQDALTVVTEAIKAVSLEAYTVQASSHAEQVQIQHSLTRQEQVLTSTAHAMNQVMTIASGQHSPSSGAEHGGSGGANDEFDVESLVEAKDMDQTQIAEAASLARAGTEVVICAAHKVAADHHRSAAATILQMSTTNGGIGSMMSASELNDLQNLNTPVVTMEEVSTTTKSAVAEAVEMTDTTASPIDVMLTAETIIQQNTQSMAVSVTVPPLLATTTTPAVPPPFSLVQHGHGVGVNVGVVPMPPNSLDPSFQDVDMSGFQVDYAMNDITSS